MKIKNNKLTIRFFLAFLLMLCQVINNVTHACVSIYSIKDSLILVGKNQDFGTWKTVLSFLPPDENNYGKSYFGGKSSGTFPLGGINSEGLFFGIQQGEYPKAMNPKGKIIWNGNIFDKIMSKCSTVQNVIDTLKIYTHPSLYRYNVLFGDKYGNSIIVEGDTVFYRNGFYQISTFFYQSEHKMDEFHFWKYDNVKKTILSDTSFSINTIRDALNSAHEVFTQLSLIYDLKKGVIYVYFYKDYEQVKIFDLKEEFKKGEHIYFLPDLFPENKAYYKTYVKRQVPQNNWLIAVFSGLFIISSIISFIIALSLSIFDKEKLFGKSISWLTKLFLGLVSVLSLIYVFRFFGNPESLQIGLFQPIKQYYSSFSYIILHIPKILVALGLVLIVLSIFHWKIHIYSLFIRIYFSIYTLLLIILISLLAYWGLIMPS